MTVLLAFQFRVPLVLSLLIAIVGTSKAMLNKSGESGHPCLVPDLRENAFSFLPLSLMLAMRLSYIGYSLLC